MTTRTTPSDLQARINQLGPWWEDIDFGPGVKTGAGRNKHILWRDYLSRSIRPDEFTGQSILDMGCNAGGNLLELSRQGPSRLVGIDAHPPFIAQAEFVKAHFDLDCEIRQYKFTTTKTWLDYGRELGSFDIMFCLGIIYHLNRDTNVQILEYMRRYGKRSFCSTQIIGVEERPKVDWDVSREGTLDLARTAGFTDIKDIYVKKDSDNWAGLTNQWYFELLP